MDKLFKIYTKTGDDGTSGLIGGTRVRKSDDRLEAYGTIDELNSLIGLIRSGNQHQNTDQVLTAIQNQLFIVGSHLATDTSKSDLHQKIPCSDRGILQLEHEIDRMQNELPALTRFILPGGSILAAQCHVARTVCRRAERRIAILNNNLPVEDNVLIYINRLSDYLFVLARYLNHLSGQQEIFWEPEKM